MGGDNVRKVIEYCSRLMACWCAGYLLQAVIESCLHMCVADHWLQAKQETMPTASNIRHAVSRAGKPSHTCAKPRIILLSVIWLLTIQILKEQARHREIVAPQWARFHDGTAQLVGQQPTSEMFS